MALIKIKQIPQKGFLLVGLMLPELGFVFGFVILLGLIKVLCRCNRGYILGGKIEHLVQFSFIEPYSPTGWAVINFNIVSLGHQQGFVTIRTFHTKKFMVNRFKIRLMSAPGAPGNQHRNLFPELNQERQTKINGTERVTNSIPEELSNRRGQMPNQGLGLQQSLGVKPH